MSASPIPGSRSSSLRTSVNPLLRVALAAHSVPQHTAHTFLGTSMSQEGSSSSRVSLVSLASQPTTCVVKPEEEGGRERLLAFVDVTKHSASHANMLVKCKTCSKEFAATKERLAAHFGLQKKLGVAICIEPPPGAYALGATVLAEIAEKRRNINKRKTENAEMGCSSAKNFRRKWNKKGKLNADKAAGQSLSVDDGDFSKATEMASSDEDSALVKDFLGFLNEAWTAYHATAEARRRLLEAGFEELDESKPSHDVKPGGKYFFTRNMSAIAAFAVGGDYAPGDGFVIVGAHTDSPCPKLKPVSKAEKAGFLQVGTQPYGGGLWHTWFDRDLGIAGRAIIKRGEGKYSHDLVRIDRPVLRIPTLAIHLTNVEERKSFSPNLQSNFYPLLATVVKAKLGSKGGVGKEGGEGEGEGGGGEKLERHHALLVEMIATELGCCAADVEDFELQLCDTQPSCLGGACSEFVLSGRLDNLCSSWQSLRALIDSCGEGGSLESSKGVRSIFLFDHEEVGSSSCHGAAGTLLPDCMKRIASGLAAGQSEVPMSCVVRKSFLVSADMAHALHPNYVDKHDPALGPKIHGGMVLKHNANQRYATNAVTAFLFREMGSRAGLPTQEFAVKSDSGCGSTIGPILSTLSGIRTVDVGSPQLSMHSVREMMGVDDAVHGYQHLKAALEKFFELDGQLSVDAVPSG